MICISSAKYEIIEILNSELILNDAYFTMDKQKDMSINAKIRRKAKIRMESRSY